jgi:hypothetical protein
LIEAHTGATAVFDEDGIVQFHNQDRILGSVLVVSGSGLPPGADLVCL